MVEHYCLPLNKKPLPNCERNWSSYLHVGGCVHGVTTVMGFTLKTINCSKRFLRCVMGYWQITLPKVQWTETFVHASNRELQLCFIDWSLRIYNKGFIEMVSEDLFSILLSSCRTVGNKFVLYDAFPVIVPTCVTCFRAL